MTPLLTYLVFIVPFLTKFVNLEEDKIPVPVIVTFNEPPEWEWLKFKLADPIEILCLWLPAAAIEVTCVCDPALLV